ncbi:MAG TPA: hypothetical protein VK812_01140 [Candidatus Binatus sp.]|nr:hypothetical protein [Candidatus Binatus sp.]
MCALALFVCNVLLGQQQSSEVRPPDAERSLARLRSKIDVERPPDLTTNAIVGRYSDTPDELRRRVVPMGRKDLYLFPDGSYFYYFSSDIPPATIRDKGAWVLSGDELTLKSDSDITWNPGVERRYLFVRRPSHPQEILAIGIDRDLRYFEENAKDDPEFMLLLVSKARVNGISAKESIELKKKLMREAWRPEFYRSQ